MDECEVEKLLEKANITNIDDLELSISTYEYITEEKNITSVIELLISLSENNGILSYMDYDIELLEMKQEIILKLENLGFRLLDNNELLLVCRILLNKYINELLTTDNKKDLNYKISELNSIINELLFNEQLHCHPERLNYSNKHTNILKRTLKKISILHSAKI